MSGTKRIILIIAACLVIIGASVGATFAYIIDRTPSVDNSFQPVYVSCTVEEQFDGVTKSEVKVRNTGDITAYIRATFIVMWTDENGMVYPASPVNGTDYSLSFGSIKWIKGSDGFYYYSDKVSAGSASEIFLNKVTLLKDAPQGYKLSLHVAATAIQAEPDTVVNEVWGASVGVNGELIAP